MGSKLSRRLLLTSLSIVFLGIVISILVNFLTSDTDILQWLKDKQITAKYLVASVVGLVVILLTLAYLQFRYEQKSNEEDTGVNSNIEPDVKKFFDSLKERYEKRYLSKLDGRFFIPLEVSEDWKIDKPKTYKFDPEAKISDAVDAVRKAFNDKGRLLIVGSPGSGKTVLLLKLALELLGNTFETDQKLPVIFDLASWSEDYNTFDDWLIDVLTSGNGLSKDFAKKLLLEKRIIFLLDGLDELSHKEAKEIAHQNRAKCLALLNNYLREGRKTVICCQRIVFTEMQKATNQDAPVSAKIEVLDLTKSDIDLALYEAKRHNESRISAKHLEKIIETNDVFLEVLSTPFYFNIAFEVFDKTILEKNHYPKTADALKIFLIRSFVEKKLSSDGNSKEYKSEKMKKWLNWLAKQMSGTNTSFELTDLQPTIVPDNWRYRVLISLVVGFVICLPLSVGMGFYYGLLNSLLAAFGVWLFIFIFLNLAFRIKFLRFGAEFGADYKTLDIIQFKLTGFWARRYLKTWIQIISLFFLMGFVFDFIHSAIISFIYIVPLLLFSMKETKYFINIEKPYQKFYNQTYFTLVNCAISLLINLFVIFYSFSINVSREFFAFILPLGLFYPAVTIFVIPLTEHLLVRALLYFEDIMPLKYVTFLNYVASLRILEKDGGQWRFRHQKLQEHFANLDIK